tara:strand:- start:857 stop:1657 length:801 start_codon:yes stop_codon:yes gene_type:complete
MLDIYKCKAYFTLLLKLIGVMMKHLNIVFFLILLTLSCEDNNQIESEISNSIDLNPPTVSFVTPSHNQTIYGEQIISIIAQDDQKVEEIEIFIKSPSSNEFSSVASWDNLTDSYASYSHSWNTELESNGQYAIKVIARDHNIYNTNGNAGASEEILVNIYNQEEDTSGGGNDGAINGYIAVKNISHNKLMGNIYGSQTRYRKVQYASGGGLNECSCMACNPNDQYDFVELYYKPSTRSIKFKKAGDQNYQYGSVPSDRNCVRYTEE